MRQQHPNTLHNGTRGSGRAAMGIRVRASAFAHPKSPHVAALDERHFVSALQLVLPRGGGDAGDGASATEGFADVSDALRRRGAGGGVDGASSLVGPAPDGDDFRVARMTLAQLVDDAFLAQHVRPESGARFFACPLDGRLDADDVVAITPSGHLRASFTPSTHARAGVTGAKTDRGTLKHEASVHLAKKEFVPGEPFRDRLVACLARLDEEGDGRGVGWYACACERATDGEPLAVRFPPGVESEGRRITHSRRLVRRGWRGGGGGEDDGDGEGPPAPPVEFFRRDRGDEACAMDADGDADGDGDDGDDCGDVATRLAGFHEWIGAVAAGVGREAWVGTAGDQEAWVGTAGDDVVAEAHRWEGLLTPRMVRSAVEFCADAVDSGRYPWAAVTSWGFPEDPTRAPGASGCGELTFAVTPGGRYLLFADSSS